MSHVRGLWFGLLLVQLACVFGAFTLRETAPKLSIACWVVFGLLLVLKYVLMFRRTKRFAEESERRQNDGSPNP
jgi:threonine/homoserine/homoserine lactone efflux protein